MKTYTVSEDFINKLLNYLATKPWIEANPLIAELQKAAVSSEEKGE